MGYRFVNTVCNGTICSFFNFTIRSTKVGSVQEIWFATFVAILRAIEHVVEACVVLRISGLFVGGAIEASLIFRAELKGDACVESRTVTLTLVPTVRLNLAIEVFAEVAKIIRGGISMTSDLLKVGIEPQLQVILKGGFSAGGKLDFVIYPMKLCLNALCAATAAIRTLNHS